MRNRKEGPDPKFPLIEFNWWFIDTMFGDSHAEIGFGITGFLWNAYRQRWWIDGTHRVLTEIQDGKKVPRPRWRRETIECRRMLHLDIQLWNRVLNISVRLWKVKWEAPTTYS